MGSYACSSGEEGNNIIDLLDLCRRRISLSDLSQVERVKDVSLARKRGSVFKFSAM